MCAGIKKDKFYSLSLSPLLQVSLVFLTNAKLNRDIKNLKKFQQVRLITQGNVS